MTRTLALPFVALIVISGCSQGESVDTTPAKPIDPQAQLQEIEKSSMTPEQKAAAKAYAEAGRTQADKMRNSAKQAGAPGAN